jgi:hypothetical protein
MDRALFGDNQFFGVNHMSEEKARTQSIRFQDTQSILDVLDQAYQNGIRTFMCTTHDRVGEVCEYFRMNSDRYPDYRFYPCMPYAHKYASAVTDQGILNALNKFLPSEGRITAAVKGGMALAGRNIETVVKMLVDAEMKMFAGLDTPVIFLQNVVTDLVLGLGAYDSFRVFANHVRQRYEAEPGFITMNLPRLLDVLEQVGLENPIVCSNINKIGFRMCGGVASYERVLAERNFRPVAMSVLASGAIPAEEALEYVCRLPRIESIVFGASSERNIAQTKALIDRFGVASNEVS